MSDNPADSLRRELEAAMLQASQELRSEALGRRSRALTLVPAEAVEAIWPLVLAALEAARADERERIAKAIEAQVPGEDEIDTWSVGYMRGMEASAVIARSPARRAVSDGN